MNEQEETVVRAVRSVLLDWEDLKHPTYSGGAKGLDGHCYHASEATYHLLGGPASGFEPYRISGFFGLSHWYLVHKDGRSLDVTEEQWEDVERRSADSGMGERRPFYTARPSQRAQRVIRKVRERGI